MEDMSLEPEDYTEVTYDHEEELYRLPNGERAKFAKFVTLRLDGDVSTHKLSYTRAWMGQPTSKPLPCVRMESEGGGTVKVRLDGWCEDDSQMTGLEVSLDSVGPA